MGGFEAERLQRTFNVPVTVTPMAMIAASHQAEAETLDAETRAREAASRSRRPLDEN